MNRSVLLACLMLAGFTLSAAEVPLVAKLPIADGLTPQEAAARMTVPEGFEVTLSAGEPLVHQPVAFALDRRGRLWVAEAYTYPKRAEDGEGKDKIVILEDTDGDGAFETRKVFIENLNLISGFELGFGGVWVGAAPYLMFIPDQDEDDIPDAPGARQPSASLAFPKDVPAGATVLLDGFGWQDTHETLNSFIWGPDGWLYGCHGVFTHSKVGLPGSTEEKRQPLNAGVWRYHPINHTFEVFAHGTSNPWGVDFNDRGQAFITACVIPHLWHMIQGGRYHRQGGQHFNSHTYDDIKTIADHLHYVGNLRDHAWWGQEPKAPDDTLAAGGGHAHCGAMIYLGDNWPTEYRNQIFMHNVHGNRINECALEQTGSGYVGHRAGDTMLANDRWFRGINLKYGPDGSVYLIDWYDKNACHRMNPEIWDRTNGRIYNISFGGKARRQANASLAKLNSGRVEDLVELQTHPNEWFVRMSRRRLEELHAKGDSSIDSVATALKSQFLAATSGEQKLRTLWTLHAIGQDDSEWLSSLLNATGDGSEYLRAWSIQLELEDRVVSDRMLSEMVGMAKSDPSPVVRLYLASALQRLPEAQRWSIVEGLVSHAEDSKDHNLPLVIWYGVEPLVEVDPGRAIKLAQSSQIETVARFIVRRAAASKQSLEHVVDWLSAEKNVETQRKILEELRQAFEGRVNVPQPDAWIAAYEALSKLPDESIRQHVDQIAIAFGDKRILPRMRTILTDDSVPLDKRQLALTLLVKGRDPEAAPSLLAAMTDSNLRAPALRALAAYDDQKIPVTILKSYATLTDNEKRDAINTLVSRPVFAVKLFDAIEKGGVPRTDVHAYHVQQMLGFKNEALYQRIKSVWGDIRATSTDKMESITKIKSSLPPSRIRVADLSNGRRLFAKTCGSCHILFGEGGKVGPDITGSNRANLDYLLENILDPSAIVGKDYQMTVIETKDGRVLSGLVQQESDSAVTLRTINDSIVVAKSDIEERKLSELSLMPEGQLNQLTLEERRDLLAYLMTPSQVPLRGPKPPIDSTSGKVPDAIEGESMKIVGKTGGNTVVQPMGSFVKDRWSSSYQLWWTGAGPGAQLDLDLPVTEAGTYDVEVVMTMAPDYGIVQLLIDGEPLGTPVDGYATDVLTTGVVSFGPMSLKPGDHKVGFRIEGANPKAVPLYMVGIDYVRLVRKIDLQ